MHPASFGVPMQKRLPYGAWRSLPAAMGLAGLYFIGGKATLSFATLTGFITPVWPVSGIALGGLLLWGRRSSTGNFFRRFSAALPPMG
jgi:hypothetical protein